MKNFPDTIYVRRGLIGIMTYLDARYTKKEFCGRWSEPISVYRYHCLASNSSPERDLRRQIGAAIGAMRVRRDLSRDEMAELAGIALSQVRELELNQNEPLNFEVLCKVLHAFDEPLHNFLIDCDTALRKANEKNY